MRRCRGKQKDPVSALRQNAFQSQQVLEEALPEKQPEVAKMDAAVSAPPENPLSEQALEEALQEKPLEVAKKDAVTWLGWFLLTGLQGPRQFLIFLGWGG